MNKVIVLLLTLFISQSLFSQELQQDYKTASNAGKFIETQGSILKVESYTDYVISSGLISGTVEIIPGMITNIRNGEKTSYIIVNSYYQDSQSVIYTSYIDFDEIPACIEALEYIINTETTSIPSNYTRVFFKTRDQLEIGAKIYVTGYNERSWKTSITHMKYVRKPSFEISIKKLPKIVEALKESMALLEEKLKSE